MTRVVKKEVVTKGSGDEGNWQMSRGYLVCVCAAVAVWIVSGVIGSPLVFCNVWMQIAL